jgi:hypothetical protein
MQRKLLNNNMSGWQKEILKNKPVEKEVWEDFLNDGTILFCNKIIHNEIYAYLSTSPQITIK